MGHNLCFISTTLERILLSEEWKSTLSVDLDKILRCHKHGNISQQKHLVGWVGPDWKDFQVRSLFSIVRFIAVRSDSRYFFDPLKPEFSQYQCSSQPLALKDIRKASIHQHNPFVNKFLENQHNFITFTSHLHKIWHASFTDSLRKDAHHLSNYAILLPSAIWHSQTLYLYCNLSHPEHKGRHYQPVSPMLCDNCETKTLSSDEWESDWAGHE